MQNLKVKLEQLVKDYEIKDIVNMLGELSGEAAIATTDSDQSRSWRQTQGVLEGAATTLVRFHTPTSSKHKVAGQ